jgi:hypothetical protein
MSALLAFVPRVGGFVGAYWRAALAIAIAGYIGLLYLRLGEERLHAAKLAARVGEASRLLEHERAEVRARTATAQAQDAAHAARVERDQIVVSRETLRDYQTQIAALRVRAAQRMRTDAGGPRTDNSGWREAGVPRLPDAAVGADGAAGEDGLPANDALIASEIAVRLKALQAWVRGQEAVAMPSGDGKVRPGTR